MQIEGCGVGMFNGLRGVNYIQDSQHSTAQHETDGEFSGLRNSNFM